MSQGAAPASMPAPGAPKRVRLPSPPPIATCRGVWERGMLTWQTPSWWPPPRLRALFAGRKTYNPDFQPRITRITRMGAQAHLYPGRNEDLRAIRVIRVIRG